MVVTDAEDPFVGEITCGTLLQNLQINLSTITFFLTNIARLLLILVWCGFFLQQKSWMKLVKVMRECLVYKRKFEQAAKSRAELLQILSDASA